MIRVHAFNTITTLTYSYLIRLVSVLLCYPSALITSLFYSNDSVLNSSCFKNSCVYMTLVSA
jgi:hypothetical protein